MVGLLDILLGGGGNPRLRLGGEDTPAGGGLLDAVGQRIMQQQYQPYMGGAAPLNAPQQAAEAPQGAPASPQPSMPQDGGGGLLGRLFGGGGGNARGRNETMAWLQSKGYSPEAAAVIAGNKKMLGSAIIQAGSPQAPTNPLDILRAKKLGLEIDDMQKPKDSTPESVRALDERAKRAGLVPGTPEYNQFMTEGGSKGVTVNNMGNIPPGYRLTTDPDTGAQQMEPIPGSPADQERRAADDQAGMRENQTAITSDTVVNAARAAREAVDGGFLPTTGTVGGWLGGTIGESNAAEVTRQTETLKAIAAAENINAMRQASKTGGALGNASDADIALLKNKAGALDPTAGAARYKAALDDYERTLLRIVHGYEAGDRIFEATRDKKGGGTGKTSRPTSGQDGVVDYRDYFGGQ